MAQTGFTSIVTYNTATASAAPVAGNLTQGELAVNVTDKKIYTKDSGGAVVQVGSGPDATETLTNKTLTSPDINGGTVDGTVIGGATPAAGSFTTLAASGALSASGNISQTGSSMLVAPAAGVAELTLGSNVASGYSRIFLKGNSTQYNWKIANSDAIGDSIEFTRSTAAAGSTYTTPVAVLSGTGLAVTGTISSSGTFSASIGTSNQIYVQSVNAGGQTLLATESSVAGTLATGSTAYAGLIGTFSNTPTQLVSNGVVRATLDTSGNLGLGVTPSAWTASFKAIDVGSFASVACESSVTADIFANTYYKPSVGFTYRTNGYASYIRQEGGAIKFNTAPSGTAGNTITFTQAMTLEASGNLFIGTTTDTGNGAAFLPIGSGSGMILRIARASEGTAHQFSVNSNVVGSIYVTATTTTYNTTSDRRLKENVRPADAKRFMDVEFVDFEWVDGRHDCGVIADQLASVYPDLVLGEKDTVDDDGKPVYQQVNYMGLIGRMGTTIQKQQRLIEALEARLTALEAK